MGHRIRSQQKPSPYRRGLLASAQILTLSLIILPGSIVSATSEPLDLPQAINLALKQNRSLARSALLVDAGRLHQDSASTEFRTNVSPDVMVTSSEDQTFVRYGPRITRKFSAGTMLSVSAGVVNSSGDGTTDNRGSVRVEVEQPLFRKFGTLAQQEALQMAGSGTLTARRAYEIQRSDLVLDVVKNYEAVVRLEQQVRADEKAVQRIDAMQLTTRALGGLASGSGADALRTEFMLGEARLALDGDREQLAAYQRLLAELLGLPPDTELSLVPVPMLELAVGAADEAVAIALKNRLELAQAQQNYVDATRNVTIAERALMPDIRLRASYDDFATSTTSVGAIPLDRQVWFLSLYSPTDFNRSRERIAVAQAHVGEQSAAIAVETIEHSITREVLQRFHAHHQALARVRLATRNLALAEGRTTLARQRFSLDHSGDAAVADAESALLAAKLSGLAARADVSITAYELSRAMGTIVESPDELKPRAYGSLP